MAKLILVAGKVGPQWVEVPMGCESLGAYGAREGDYAGTESLIRQLLTAAHSTATLPAATQTPRYLHSGRAEDRGKTPRSR